jgi:hypothetical protein
MMNLGAGIVPGNITLNGVGANYSIAIGGGAPIVGVAAVGHPVVYPINLATVHLTNTTAAAGPSNLMVTW